MKIRGLSQSDVQFHPEMVWNAYVDLLSTEDPRELSVIQRPAQIVFWYERDVQKGGHKQYFQRHGPGSLEPTLEALGLLGAKEQQQILKEAAAAQLRRETAVPTTLEQYIEWVDSINLAGFDARFRGCSSGLTKHLQAYLNNHLSSFVVVREGNATVAWKNPWAIYGMMHVVGIPLCYVGMATASRPIVLAGSALLLPSSLLVPGLLWSVPGEPVAKGGELVFALAFAAVINFAIFGLYRGLKRISRWGRTSPTGQRLHQVLRASAPPR